MHSGRASGASGALGSPAVDLLERLFSEAVQGASGQEARERVMQAVRMVDKEVLEGAMAVLVVDKIAASQAPARGGKPRIVLRTTLPHRARPRATRLGRAARSAQPVAAAPFFRAPTEAEREAFFGSDAFLSSEQMAERLGLQRQAVQKAIDSGRMLGFQGKGRQWRIPAFYADATVSRPQLEEVTRALGEEMPAGEKYQFFTTRWGTLDDASPLDALRAGRFDEVMAFAHAHGAAE